MRTFCTTLFFLILSQSLISQVWVNQGATWHYDFDNWFDAGFNKYEYTQDSLLDGHLCQVITHKKYNFLKLDSYSFSGIVDRPSNFTYVSGDTVFYRNDGEFFVLFNFGAQIGDSWVISTTSSNSGVCSDTSKVVVTDIGTLLIDGINYRTINVEPTSDSPYGINGTYIERFGLLSNNYYSGQFLFPFIQGCGNIYEYDAIRLKCFEDSTITYHNPIHNSTGQDCEYLLDHLDIDNIYVEPFLIKPNPAKNQILISSQSQKQFDIKVYNLLGDIVLELTNESAELPIDISQLKKGVYMIEVYENKVVLTTEKLIKL